jgi:hypothetical protein
MNETIDHHARADELTIEFHFVDGEKFTQSLPIDDADAAQDVMEWFRDPKGGPVWTWRHPHSAMIQMIPRSKITFIQINGFIDLDDGKESKWYHRLIFRFQSYLMLRKGSGVKWLKRSKYQKK